MTTKQSLPKMQNNVKQGYVQPIFNDELSMTFDSEMARDISNVVNSCASIGFVSNRFKSQVVKMLDDLGYAPMWTCRQESPNGGHAIFELDVDGQGTGIMLQIDSIVGIYNVFKL